MSRPEYVKCVADTEGANPGKSWCGRDVVRGLGPEWTFVSIDHAAMNGRKKGRLIVCADCARAIVTALKEGH